VTYGLFPEVTEVEDREDALRVIQVGRFWRVFINGQILTRTRTVDTPEGWQEKTEPREFHADMQAWRFLGEVQRRYKRKYGVDLGWEIKGEV